MGVDRFFGALKSEYARLCMLLLPIRRINERLRRYQLWHGRFRPHQGLEGWTPDEVFFGRKRRGSREERVEDLRLACFRGDRRLPVYHRVLAA